MEGKHDVAACAARDGRAQASDGGEAAPHLLVRYPLTAPLSATLV